MGTKKLTKYEEETKAFKTITAATKDTKAKAVQDKKVQKAFDKITRIISKKAGDLPFLPDGVKSNPLNETLGAQVTIMPSMLRAINKLRGEKISLSDLNKFVTKVLDAYLAANTIVEAKVK